MRKTGLVIYSVLLWTFFVCTCILMFCVACLIWLLTKSFDRRLVGLHIFSSLWGSLYIWLNPLWSVRVKGRRKIPWKRPAVLVSNHQSMLDILVLYQLFSPYKWVSKKENFSIPIIGWLMRLNAYLEIERGSRGSYPGFMRKAGLLLKQGSSLLIFPEGTRYPGGALGPFREGAFRMALDNAVDIVPVVLDGTARALPRKGVILTGHARIRVHVLDPLPYDDFSGSRPEELMNRVRRLMSEEYARIRAGDNGS